MVATQLLKDLISREEQLMDNVTRADPHLVSGLMEDRCIDVSEGGSRLMYRTGDTLSSTEGISYITTDSASISSLSADCTLLSYTAARVVVDKQSRVWHSSIWRQSPQGWKRVYHQGTTCLKDR